MTLTQTAKICYSYMTIWGKGLQQQQYNNTTTKQQTQDYETTRRRYATRRLKTLN